ncbi:MAG: hypothetical protein M0T77_02710 [Actinomycetota bacterium]|nr:hypothetical protein [Actinomycetota bacterium]
MSSSDSSAVGLTSSVADAHSLGAIGPDLGRIEFCVYIGTPDSTTVGQWDELNAPFAAQGDC